MEKKYFSGQGESSAQYLAHTVQYLVGKYIRNIIIITMSEFRRLSKWRCCEFANVEIGKRKDNDEDE